MVWERRLEDNVFQLHKELRTGSYQHSSYTPFKIRDPKEREIHKATVKDRIVHQAVVSAIEPIFEPRFIFDSYSCRIGRGTHAASKRLQRFCRKASRNNTRTIYVLKLDIKKFFDSVEQQILYKLLCRHISDTRILHLLKKIIGSFSTTRGKGLPLGNLTSQLFANIYLHELDYFVKHKLHERWYLRYCDDFVIVHPSRTHVLGLVSTINNFLHKHLALSIHPEKMMIRTWSQGLDFVGYVHAPCCVVVRTKTAKRMVKRTNHANLASYWGLCSHANSFGLQQILLNKVGDLKLRTGW